MAGARISSFAEYSLEQVRMAGEACPGGNILHFEENDKRE
jgi:hypothetical protein